MARLTVVASRCTLTFPGSRIMPCLGVRQACVLMLSLSARGLWVMTVPFWAQCNVVMRLRFVDRTCRELRSLSIVKVAVLTLIVIRVMMMMVLISASLWMWVVVWNGWWVGVGVMCTVGAFGLSWFLSLASDAGAAVSVVGVSASVA